MGYLFQQNEMNFNKDMLRFIYDQNFQIEGNSSNIEGHSIKTRDHSDNSNKNQIISK